MDAEIIYYFTKNYLKRRVYFISRAKKAFFKKQKELVFMKSQEKVEQELELERSNILDEKIKQRASFI